MPITLIDGQVFNWMKSQETDDLREKLDGVNKLLNNEKPKAIQNIVRRQCKKNILRQRIGMRPESSSGRSKSLDEEDEKFIQGCIEKKATAHGRRPDAARYMNHRVKKK